MAGSFPSSDDLTGGYGDDIGTGEMLTEWMGDVGERLNDLQDDPPVVLPPDGDVGQVITNTAPGEGEWADLPDAPDGLPSDGEVGQVVTNTAPGEGEWADIPIQPSSIRVNSGAEESSLAITKQPVIPVSGIPQPLPPMFGFRFPGTPTFFSVNVPVAPGGLCTGPDGLLYGVSGSGSNGYLLKIALDGTYTSASLGTCTPLGVSVGPDGNLWVVDQTGAVIRVAPNGSGLTRFALAGSACETTCAGPDGNIWVADVNGAIWKVTPTGTATKFTTVNAVFGVCAGPDGNIWGTGGPQAFKITPDGELTNVGPTMIGSQGGIAQGADGNIWVADLTGHQVFAITPDGTTVHTVPLPSGSLPYTLCSGAGGDIWVTGNGNGSFFKITTAGELTSFLLDNAARPYWVCSAGDGGLWISDTTFEGGGVWLEPFIMQANGMDLNSGPLIVKGKEITAGLPPDGTPGQVVTNTGAGEGEWDDLPETVLPPDGSPGQVITNTAPGEGDWADLPDPPIGLPPDGTPGQVVTNTGSGTGDWEDLPDPPIGLPPSGSPGQVVTNTAPGEGAWDDLPDPPIGLPPDGSPGQVVTNTAPGEGDWEDLPELPIGLPPDGTPGQVVTNTAPGEGDWEDLPASGLPAGGSVGQIVTNTGSGEGDWANPLVTPVSLFDSVTTTAVTVPADGGTHTITMGDATQSNTGGLSMPRPWLGEDGIIIEPGLYRVSAQMNMSTNPTTPGLFIYFQSPGGNAEAVSVDGLVAIGTGIQLADTIGLTQEVIDILPIAIPTTMNMPTDDTLSVGVTLTFSRLLAY